ncbi:MAG TPA: ABC transporter permease [Candidatus Eisenbacteria bacterium]|jgi:putative ABC transport system permease protein
MTDGFLFRETFRIARQALNANRMRSLLALLGIVIGVGTVIAMGSLINGFRRSFEKGIASFGSNSIYIRTFRPGAAFVNGIPDSLRKRRAFTLADANAIAALAPSVAAVSVIKIAAADIRLSYQDRHTKVTLTFGSNDGFMRTRGFEISSGRFFTAEEVDHRANVVVLGSDTRDALFQTASPIGRTVHLNEIPFTVIGVFVSKGRFLHNNFDEVACIPWTVADKYWEPGAHAPPWMTRRGEVFLDAVPVEESRLEQAMREIRAVLRVRRHVPSNRPDDFEVFSEDAFITVYNTVTGGIVALMMLISSIALVVGGIGVMNIMLVAVTERTREIGVRKALGAPRRAILLQFLFEAVMLTAIGGVLGILLGSGVAQLVRSLSGLPTFVSPGSVVAGIAVSTFTGIFCGLYPAMRASRLDPVEALRYE